MSGPKVGRGTIYHMIARGIFLVSDFIVHVYFARKLGPEVYGICGVVLALLAIISQPLNIGLNQSVSKYVAEDHRRAKTLLHQGIKYQLLVIAFLMIVFLGMAGPASSLLKAADLRGYLILAAFVLPGLGIFTILLGLFNGMRSFGREALALCCYPIARTVVIVFLIYLGYSVDGVIWGFIVGLVLATSLATVLFKAPEERVGFEGRKLRTFAIPVFLLGLVMIIIPNIDLLFVKGIVVEEREAGIYNSARVLARASYFFFLAMGQTIFPSISESVSAKDQQRTASYISQGVRYLMMMTLPVAFLVAACGTEIISLIFSATYEGGGGALGILMFGFTLLTLFSILTTILLAGDRARWALTGGLLLIPIDIVLNVILVPRYQLVGAAFATSLTAVCGVTVASMMVWREFNTLWEVRSLLNITLASVIVYALVRVVEPTGYYLIPWIVASLILYGVLLLVFRELRTDDWLVFRGILRLSPAFSSHDEQRKAGNNE